MEAWGVDWRVHWLPVFGRSYGKEESMGIQQSTFSISALTRHLGCSGPLQFISVSVCFLCLWKSFAKLHSAQKLCIPFLSPLSVLLALFNHSSWEVFCHQDEWSVDALPCLWSTWRRYSKVSACFSSVILLLLLFFPLVHSDTVISSSTIFV